MLQPTIHRPFPTRQARQQATQTHQFYRPSRGVFLGSPAPPPTHLQDPMQRVAYTPPPAVAVSSGPSRQSPPARDIISARPARKRSRSATIVESFLPEAFVPTLWTNSHAQTIAANFYPPAPEAPVAATEVFETQDGADVVYVDVVGGSCVGEEGRGGVGQGRDVALVIHGLEADSRGIVCKRIASAFVGCGFKVLLFNFRGCFEGEKLPRSCKSYHAGFYEDVVPVLRAAAVAKARIHLVGFSLGSNVMLNMLGDLPAETLAEFNVVSATGISVPYDTASCQRRIDAGLSGITYASRLATSISAKVLALKKNGIEFPPSVSMSRVGAARRIAEIDDAYVAPIFGFKDRFDYYDKIDVRPRLASISVPTYLINARDDPFFDHVDDARGNLSKSLPTVENIGDAPVLIYLPPHGGHCGFVDSDGWNQRRAMYGAREMARFCAHVRDELVRLEKAPAGGGVEDEDVDDRPKKAARHHAKP